MTYRTAIYWWPPAPAVPGWTISSTSTMTSALSSRLKIDTYNVPHLSYVNATWDLLNYAKWNVATSDWYTTTVDYFDVGGYTSIATDGLSAFGNVKPGISYFDFVQEEIRYAYHDAFRSLAAHWHRRPIGIPKDRKRSWNHTARLISISHAPDFKPSHRILQRDSSAT